MKRRKQKSDVGNAIIETW